MGKGRRLRPGVLNVWIFIAAMAAAETLISVGHVRVGARLLPTVWAGITVDTVLLVFLIVLASMSDGWAGRLYLALMLAPLIRLLSLVLPMTTIPLVYRYVAVSIPLFVAAFAVARMSGLRLRDISLTPGKWWQQAAIALVGLPMGVTEYHILRPAALIPAFRPSALVVPSLVLLICTGFLEELIFRGIIQKAAGELLGRGGAILYVALLFAAMHITHQSWPDVGYVFLVGVFFSWAVFRTRSLTGVTLAHGINNILLYLVLPFFPLIIR